MRSGTAIAGPAGPSTPPLIPYGVYISRVFNFANLESFVKFIQLKF